MSTETKDTLSQHIQAGRISDAVALVTSPSDYNSSEQMIFAVLKTENCPQEVIDAALERFAATRENRYEKHGYWVHSLSHFTKKLWERGDQKGWIKRLNEIAFTGANELGDDNCSGRLLNDFVQNASWDSVPAEYGYTAENLRWAGDGDKYSAYNIALIKALPFASEADFIKFELARPERFTKFDYEAQNSLVDGEKFQKAVNRLKELGADTSEFDSMLESMLRTSLEKFETMLGKETHPVMIERATKAIEKTKAMLAAATTK